MARSSSRPTTRAASIAAVRPSEYTLTVEGEGFEPYQEALSFQAGEEKRQEIRLVPAISAPEAAFARGIEAFNAGNFEEARETFEEVTRLSPETPEGHSNLALAYIQLGRMPKAVQELEKAAELSPDSFQTWAQLAMAYVQVDRLQAAVRGFETALEKQHDPSDPMAIESRMTLGALYFSENRVEEAVKAYENALAADPRLRPGPARARQVPLQPRQHGRGPPLLRVCPERGLELRRERGGRAFIDEIDKQSAPPCAGR